MLILCADDYALTEGVSRAIGELAAARRLSATSAMVTRPHWRSMAPRLAAHRGHLAVGLHLNLTLGTPAGAMPKLAPGGQLPGRNVLVARTLAGLIDVEEIGGEIERQLDAFEAGAGFPPDHIDGHEHVQVLPGIRSALLQRVALRYKSVKPLVRIPSDTWAAMRARRTSLAKAAAVRTLSLGFAAQADRVGIPTNMGFSGFSSFDVTVPYEQELSDALLSPGPRHIVMCHPGHPDAELATVDPVVQRRRMEYDALMRDATLPERIWRPARNADGAPVDWTRG
jgi:predicted glycoside hydrolase/deacetylase ChbG (UPF0249 family)